MKRLFFPIRKSIKKSAIKRTTSILAMVFLLTSFLPIQTKTAKASGEGTWTQTDWSGGSGQDSWSDETKFEEESGEGLYLNSGNLRMKANADVVIGQEDFTSGSANQGGSVGADTLNNIYGVANYGNKFIVADYSNHRVLIYNSIPASSNASADVVIGQTDFTHNSANQGGLASDNTLNGPLGVTVSDNGKLIISDAGNNRVLIYNSIPTSNNVSASVVIGQIDFTQRSANQGGGVEANTLLAPFGLAVSGDKLFIADGNNHRVLIYNSIPSSNNVSADVVIGQEDFTHGSENQGGDPDANTLGRPIGVDVFGGKVFISEHNNHRVLIYNAIPTENNASADVVIGQEDFSGKQINQGESVSARGLSFPQSVYVYQNRAFIADWVNYRSLIFSSIPASNNAPASEVICQPDFTHNSSDQGGSLAANTLKSANDLIIYDNKFILSDPSNHRVLIFNMSSTSSILTSSTNTQTEEKDWGPITWDADTTSYSDVETEVSTDGGETWKAVNNN